jgi:hypothetical protein
MVTRLNLQPASEPGDETLDRALTDQARDRKIDAAMDAAAREIVDSNQTLNRQRYEADKARAEPTAPAFLSSRRALLIRDIANMRAKKAEAQAEIVRQRRLCFELTQSIRSNEDALDRLLEAEG